MAIVILPDAQADLLDLQDYMLERWTPELWTAAEDDLFAQIAQVDSGFITGPVVPLLASVGMTEYRTVLSSHHRILYRRIDGNTYVYAVAGQAQDFQTLLLRRLFQAVSVGKRQVLIQYSSDGLVYVEAGAELSFSNAQAGGVIEGDLIAACDLVFPKVTNQN